MRILIEHTVTTPYQPGSPHGGTERFCHQAMLALRAAGHEADVFVTSDTDQSLPFTCQSGIASTLTSAGRFKEDGSPKRTFTDLVGWYTSLDKAAKNYDYVILNSAFNSYGLFERWSFMPKSVLINHFCHPGMIEGEGGLRLQLLGRWLRQMGGRCFSSGASNIIEMQKRWDKPHKRERMLLTYKTWIDRCGIDVDYPLFEGWVDVNVIPNDRAEFALINPKKIVAIGRPVKEKQTLNAALAMEQLAELGYECHIFTTDIGEDFEAIKKIGLAGKIRHHINRPHAEIMLELVDARCLLFPSKSETNGIVAAEAATHGVPVIYQCDEPDFFLQPAGLGHKFSAKNAREVISSLVTLAQQVSQTDEERFEKRSYFDEKYSEAALAQKLIDILPTEDRPTIAQPFYEPVPGKLVSSAGTKKEPKHKQINTVVYKVLNRADIPDKDRLKTQIYRIIIDGETFGVGLSSYVPDRIDTGYAWCVRTMKYDGSTVIKDMQQLAIERGNHLEFEAELLEVVDWEDGQAAEKRWIEHFRAQGHQLRNKTPAPKPKKIAEPKAVKEAKPGKPSSIGTQLPITKEEVESLFGLVKLVRDSKIAAWYEGESGTIIAFFNGGGGSGKDIPEDAIYLVKTEQGFFACTKAEWCDNGTIRNAAGYQKPGFGQIAPDRFNSAANRPYRRLEI